MEEQKIYKVSFATDTLESIAEETGYTPEEIKEWHNNHSYYFITSQTLPSKILLPPYPPKPKPVPTPEEKKKKFLENLQFGEESKYRCEQSVSAMINGMPLSSANTKTEFTVKRAMQDAERPVVQIHITDNIVTLSPAQYQEAVNLVAGLDFIKCKNLSIGVNAQTGEMENILNMPEVIASWQEAKTKLQENSAFIKSKKGVEAVRQFIDLADKQITDQKNLLQDLQAKMFFFVYFSKYLVNAKDKYEPYRRTFHSQLFEGTTLDLDIKQEIIRETKEETVVQKTSGMNTLNNKQIEEAYNQKYKPQIQYKFSEYRAEYTERCLYGEEEDTYLKEAQVNILEEVKNNVQLLISCNLKKIE